MYLINKNFSLKSPIKIIALDHYQCGGHPALSGGGAASH
jgi:hypothetical protein